MAYEFQLPVVIIQHIQSFLGGKQAAQTVVLSKSWFAAWWTRPTLYFDEGCFPPKTGNDAVSHDFPNFARKTVQRYKESNLYVDKLVLIMSNNSSTRLADELIRDALKLRANELVLTITNKPCVYKRYVLPAQVFAAISLTKLYVSSCEINHGRALFSRLTSLSLVRVYVKDEILRDILLGCPLIENFLLLSCEGLGTVNVSKMRKLVQLSVAGWINVEFEDSEIGFDVAEFRYLRTLQFERVKINKEFFTGFSSRFPCIQNLLLKYVPCEEIEISSSSLRYLSVLHERESKKMRFNVPNISKFVFKGGYDIPFLSIGTASRDWESNLQFAFSHDVIEDSWFVELRKLLTELSPSRISLHIKFCGKCNVSAERIPCFPIPVVENLSVDASPVSHMSPSRWRCLFWSCRPSFITECDSIWWSGHDPFILHDLYELLRGDSLFYRMYNLEEVNLELFDENLMEWQTIPLETLVDVLKIPHHDEEIRFRFSWGAGGLTC